MVDDQKDEDIFCSQSGRTFEEYHRGTWYICNTGLSHMNKGLEASVPCTTILFGKLMSEPGFLGLNDLQDYGIGANRKTG
jgi:hypothetical protein